jgi:flavin reductase (DIM6/NTAB) family NADH-FMN oxidoreductase RutF
MGCFATGVTILTTHSDGKPSGMTVNSFTSVSLQPALVLICLANEARTTTAVRNRGWFAVNILADRQAELSQRFAQKDDDRFNDLDFTLDEYNMPLLPGCIAHLVCRVFRIDPGGDHIIVLGEVVKVDINPGNPLLFFRGGYAAIATNAIA